MAGSISVTQKVPRCPVCDSAAAVRDGGCPMCPSAGQTDGLQLYEAVESSTLRFNLSQSLSSMSE